MNDGTNVGRTPHARPEVSPDKKTDARPRAQFQLRCPDWGQSNTYHFRADAISAERRLPCPDCNRMRGISKEVPTGE